MKTVLGIMLTSFSITLLSCNWSEVDRSEKQDFSVFQKELAGKLSTPTAAKPVFYVSGVYTFMEQNDFCITWDTVWVAKIPTAINGYTIRRKTVFQRNVGEHVFARESYPQTWTGSYNAASQKMEAFSEAQALHVNAEQTGLEMDGGEYHKIQ